MVGHFLDEGVGAVGDGNAERGRGLDVDRIDADAKKKVEDAIEFAEASPQPAPEDALTDVYVAYR